MIPIQPKAAHYAGIQFRSRLEASWAFWFDAHGPLGIRWQYENQAFRFSDGTYYLPDFWLPDARCWVEVKGSLDAEDRHKVLELARAASERDERVILCGSPAGMVFGVVEPTGELNLGVPWVRCRYCDKWTLQDSRCTACGFVDRERTFIDQRWSGEQASRHGSTHSVLPIAWERHNMVPREVDPHWAEDGLRSMSEGLRVINAWGFAEPLTGGEI